MTKLIANRFLKKIKIGRGGFGDVFLAEDTKYHTNIVLKKIRVRDIKNQGLDTYALEEIKQLQEISHPNIVHLVGVFRKKKTTFIGFEFLSYDLEKILEKKISKTLTMPEIKYTFKAIISGLSYLHSMNYLHRDIKPGNIMFTNDGIAKIIDFGLSCEIPSDNMICQATTLPYRAPELLYGSKKYGAEVDIWSAGCLLFELLTSKVLFDGVNDFAMLKMIALAFGPIEWPGCTELQAYIRIKPIGEVVPLAKRLEGFSYDAIDLVEKCLCLDPKKRITAADALKHPFFNDSADRVDFQ